MSKIEFDVSDVDHEDATKEKVYELPPAGVYPVRLAEVDAEAPEGKQPRLHVVAEITKPAKNNYGQFHDYIVFSDASKWKLDQFLSAVGVTSATKRTGSVDTAKLKGKLVQVKIGHETSTYEGTTRTRGRINFWFPAGKKGAGTVAAAAGEEKSVDEEMDLVMHGAAADEGDDESISYLTEQATAYDIDPDTIDSWAEVAVAIEEAQQGDEAEEEEDSADDEAVEGEGPDADLVEAADGGDEDAANALYEWASENEGGDPDSFDTWEEWAASLGGEAEEGEEQDYESMSLVQLKTLAKERGISPAGKSPDLIKRHMEYDETDPFTE